MPGKTERKRFVKQAEEPAWWEENQENIVGAFEKVVTENYSGPCTVVITGDSNAAKIRLGSRDVRKVREQAAKHGMRFHKYLKSLIHESLRKTKKRKPSTIRHESKRRKAE